MFWKPIAAIIFLALVLPREPDIGMGRPSLFPPALERIQTGLFHALAKVRADLKKNGGKDHDPDTARAADEAPFGLIAQSIGMCSGTPCNARSNITHQLSPAR